MSTVCTFRHTRQKLCGYVLVLLFIISFSARAQVIHIDTIGCGVDETDTSYINKMVRHEARFYDQIFSTHKNDTASINICLYGNARAYIRAVKLNKLNASTNGLYSPGLNKNFVYKNEIYLHVLLRSTCNNLLLNNYANAPKWLTDGMASVMSYTDETGDRKVVYTPLFDYNKQIKDQSWDTDGVDFDSLFSDDNPDWNRKGRGGQTLHALSYGIIYFLITQDKEDHLTPIIASMKAGHTATDAITASFGSFDDFKNKFLLYYRYAAPTRFSAARL